MCMQVNVYKDPVTDPGKMSRRGRMTLELDGSGQYVTRTEGSGDPHKVRDVSSNSRGTGLETCSLESLVSVNYARKHSMLTFTLANLES